MPCWRDDKIVVPALPRAVVISLASRRLRCRQIDKYRHASRDVITAINLCSRCSCVAVRDIHSGQTAGGRHRELGPIINIGGIERGLNLGESVAIIGRAPDASTAAW